jgi:hypothetical protein
MFRWWCKATWKGAVLAVDGQAGPLEAVEALVARVQKGARCARCGRRRRYCWWREIGGRWEPGCPSDAEVRLMARCPVRLKAWTNPDGSAHVLDCRLDEGHGPEHAATGLFPHQTIYWLDGDRRAFTGEFTPCDESRCILPAGHRGAHSA